jgi:tetratricopeptide (TPR) repeat protein
LRRFLHPELCGMPETNREDIQKLETLFAANPAGRVFTHLAEAYRKAGELDRALEVLQQGLQRYPEYSSAHVVLGRVLWDRGEHERAAEGFRRVLELDPQNLVALRALADLSRERGRIDEALERYRELLGRDPGNEEFAAVIAELESAPRSAAAPAEPAGLEPSAELTEVGAEAGEAAAVEAPEAGPAETAPAPIELAGPDAEDVAGLDAEPLVVETPPPAAAPEAGAAETADDGSEPEPITEEAALEQVAAAADVDRLPDMDLEETFEPGADAEPLPDLQRPTLGFDEEVPPAEGLERDELPTAADAQDAERLVDDVWPDEPLAAAADEPEPTDTEGPAPEDIEPLDLLSVELPGEAADAAAGADAPAMGAGQVEDAPAGELPWIASPADVAGTPTPAHDQEWEEEQDEVVTETMGDLYAAQELYAQAAAVYEALLERRPTETRLHRKLQRARQWLVRLGQEPGAPPQDTVPARRPPLPELVLTLAELVDEPSEGPATTGPVAADEALADAEPAIAQRAGAADAGAEEDEQLAASAWAGTEQAAPDAPSPYGWPGEAAQEGRAQSGDLREYFHTLLSWRPGGLPAASEPAETAPRAADWQDSADAEPPRADWQDSADVADWGAPDAEDAVEVDETSALFGTDGTPGGGHDEFDLLFGADQPSEEPTGPLGAGQEVSDTAPPATRPRPGAAQPPGAARPGPDEASDEDEDLEMFRSWLQSLKR